MKKIFLLTLLSVFFLSAFCQTSTDGTEIISKISVNKFIADEEMDDPLLGPSWWWFWKPFYLYVNETQTPTGVILTCEGRGWKLCRAKRFFNTASIRGLAPELVENTYERINDEYEDRIIAGEYRGSITKKIAFSDPLANGRTSYLLFLMNWDNDPIKHYNGKAEIIISKTNDLGISTGRE